MVSQKKKAEICVKQAYPIKRAYATRKQSFDALQYSPITSSKELYDTLQHSPITSSKEPYDAPETAPPRLQKSPIIHFKTAPLYLQKSPMIHLSTASSRPQKSPMTLKLALLTLAAHRDERRGAPRVGGAVLHAGAQRPRHQRSRAVERF